MNITPVQCKEFWGGERKTYTTFGSEPSRIGEALTRSSFDVLLVDDGFDTAAVLHKQYPEIPLIVLVTSEEKRFLQLADRLGLWDVIHKSETDRLALSVGRAPGICVFRESYAALVKELAQAREVFLKCQKSITMGRLLGESLTKSTIRWKRSRTSYIWLKGISSIQTLLRKAFTWLRGSCTVLEKLQNRF